MIKFIITIDGPAGSGKSTIAKMLAEKIGALHLSSGKIYRAIALIYEKKNGKIDEVLKEAEKINLDELEKIENELVSEKVGRKASEISRIPQIREKANEIQRKIVLSSGKSFVVDGRDEGTVVFPNADIKIYLDATAEERAKRKLLDERRRKRGNSNEVPGEKEDEISEEELRKFLKEISERDKMDSEREIAPLKIPEGGIYIDSTGKSPEEVLMKILEEIRKRKPEILRSLNEDLL